MRVFVRYCLGPVLELDLKEESSVLQLKEEVGRQQGVQPDHLRVLFAGRELLNSASLQSCDLPEMSTVHVVLPPPSPSSPLLLLQERIEEGGEVEELHSLTRLDLNSSRLPPSPPASPTSLSEQGGSRGVDEEQEAPPPGNQSNFYVYCKRCSSIKPGKLRVRCGNCKQTTMTLCRGPSCWDDVLLPGRISGSCQSDGCHGNQAEFFMKCAAHPTSDEDVSVALDLIMNNNRNVSCIACTDIMDLVLVFPCAERHVICLDCFRGYCQSRLNERRFIPHPHIGYSLPCAVGCADSLIQEIHHFRILGAEQYSRYLQYGAEECVLAAGGLLCPSPGCGAGLIPTDDERRVTCDRRFGCGFQFCRQCREAYHQGLCPDIPSPPPVEPSQGFAVEEEACLRGRWENASVALINESTRRCPQCSVPTERSGGCMHMCCPRCGAEWCWLCRAFWTRDCMGNHWFG